jgi:hypothetical protein
MRIGVTGHQRLEDEADWPWVESAMQSTCSDLRPPLVGLSSLAIGADQLFARVILSLGGTLEIIVPFSDYAERFETAAGRSAYEELLARASKVTTLPRTKSDEHGYLAAGQAIAASCDVLLAVWNGRPSNGLGGTADIVQFALQNRRPIIHLDPCARTISRISESTH